LNTAGVSHQIQHIGVTLRHTRTTVVQGGVKELKAMETCKNKNITINYPCFCAATIVLSKIIADIIANYRKHF